jgi:4-hydroxybenzoate polyprenyltransferase
VITMLLIRPLDDIRDVDYDRRVNPGRPLPSGLVTERDLMALVVAGTALVLLINSGRGVALVVLVLVLSYTGVVVALERLAGWPGRDRLVLQLAVNLPILALLSLYVYAGFLRAEQLRPSAVGLVAVLAVTIGALCPEFGRKVSRQPGTGERSYVTVLGPSGTSLAALGAAAVAAVLVLAALGPWRSGYGWGWLLLVPLALPALAAARFAAGAPGWPARQLGTYLPTMYCSFLAAGWLTKGTVR